MDNLLDDAVIHRDMLMTVPQLYMEVFVVGDASEEAAFAEMFVRAECFKASSVETADLVVFTGGEDVNPALYGKNRHESTMFHSARDEEDMLIYEKCLKLGIPMFGVCRGAQFLHVMNGGALYQDVDHHNGKHQMYDRRARQVIQNVSSVHHQMCRPNPEGGMEILGTSYARSKTRWIDDKVCETGNTDDIEAFWYPDTICFGVQGHPEYRGYSEFTKWTLNMIEHLFVHNPDIALIDRTRRLKPDLIAQRELKWHEAEEKMKGEANA